jgi:hypothetical protein
MEIIEGDNQTGDLVHVASVADRQEGAIVHGLLMEAGIPSLARDGRVRVRAAHADAARKILAETMVVDPDAAVDDEEPPEDEVAAARAETIEAFDAEIPEPVNAAYLADANRDRMSIWARLVRRRR